MGIAAPTARPAGACASSSSNATETLALIVIRPAPPGLSLSPPPDCATLWEFLQRAPRALLLHTDQPSAFSVIVWGLPMRWPRR